MPIFNIPNITSAGTDTGIDDFIILTIAEVPIFTPMFLFFVFSIVLVGGITAQKRRSVTIDLPMWVAVASLSTFLISFPLTLSTGLIDTFTLSIVVSVTLMSGIWLFLDRSRREA